MFGRAGLPYIRVHYIIVCILATQTVAGNLFSSIHDMEALADQESQLIHTLKQYITSQQSRLDLLYGKLEQVMKARPPWLNSQEIIGDPINAFSLVRRLTREWPITLNLMVSNAVVTDIERDLSLLPGEGDMTSAVRGIVRLQEAYDLETTQFTQGRNLANWGHLDFTARDCFEIGKHLSREHKYHLARSWFKEALDKIIRNDSTIQQDRVLTHLFPASFYADCKDRVFSGNAPNVLQYLMSQYPNYTLEGDSSQIFRETVSSNSNCGWSDEVTPKMLLSRAFSEICRGIDKHFSSDLRCFYINYNNPRLLIAPFKMEELYLNPPILMFHDVVSDQEIQEMKTAFNKVRARCKIIRTDNDSILDYYRQCDVGWVEDTYINTSARLTRRAGDMTNLALKSSEPNQVASYGLGGEYLPHHDTILAQGLPHSPNGHRLATLMFYLNDVESGGFTVFMALNVTVIPKKGSAVFWFNINHRSEGLGNMLHGGCPVLRGSKWVLNKWIHEGGQNSDLFCPTDETFPKQRYYLAGNKKWLE